MLTIIQGGGQGSRDDVYLSDDGKIPRIVNGSFQTRQRKRRFNELNNINKLMKKMRAEGCPKSEIERVRKQFHKVIYEFWKR